MPGAEHHVLSGWGGAHHGWARVRRPGSAGEVANLLADATREGRRVALRGAGRSYGDAAVLARGDVLDLTAMDRVLAFDADLGRIVVEPGVTFETLWRTALPRGFWPAVVPGTMRPTVGGALAMNIHGKNHFRVGGFGEHVEEITLVTTAGDVRTLRPGRDDEVFRAVVGGAGLLGVVTSATLRLKRVHSGLLDVTAVPVRSLEALVAEFERRTGTADYLVGWIDAFDPAGRSVLHEAKHLAEGEDDRKGATLAAAAQELPAGLAMKAAPFVLSALASPAGMSFVNWGKHRSARFRGVHSFRQSHVQFAFLLDYVPNWKRMYDPGGLVQHQSFVPREHALLVHTELLALCRARRIVPWLGVVKRHRACPYLMTHAVDGYSLALDFPVTGDGRERLFALCRDMDEIVLAAGGRFYFAKDLTASAASVPRAFPNLDRFRELKRELDPAGTLTSDLAIRLGLAG